MAQHSEEGRLRTSKQPLCRRNGGKRLKFSFQMQSRNSKLFDCMPDIPAVVLLVPEQVTCLYPHLRSDTGSIRSLFLIVLTLLITFRGKQALSRSLPLR
jgi:hypothetical protein